MCKNQNFLGDVKKRESLDTFRTFFTGQTFYVTASYIKLFLPYNYCWILACAYCFWQLVLFRRAPIALTKIRKSGCIHLVISWSILLHFIVHAISVIWAYAQICLVKTSCCQRYNQICDSWRFFRPYDTLSRFTPLADMFQFYTYSC